MTPGETWTDRGGKYPPVTITVAGVTGAVVRYVGGATGWLSLPVLTALYEPQARS